MSKDPIINWGILGTARIARKRMINAIQESEGNICLAIASRNEKKAKEVANRFNVPRFYGNYQALLDDVDIDAVYIPLPNSLHHEWTIRSAEKNKHILCEKPLSISQRKVLQMIEACRKHDVLLFEAFSYKYHPQYQRLNELIKDGIIGRIKKLLVYFSFIASPPAHAIRFDAELGGGSLLDLGCYGIDVAQLIAQERFEIEPPILNIANGVDLEFCGVLKSNTCRTIIRTSFINERQQTLTVCGDKGMIFLPTAFVTQMTKTEIVIHDGNKSWIEKIEEVDQYKFLVDEFRKHIISKDKDNIEVFYKTYLSNIQMIDQFKEQLYAQDTT